MQSLRTPCWSCYIGNSDPFSPAPILFALKKGSAPLFSSASYSAARSSRPAQGLDAVAEVGEGFRRGVVSKLVEAWGGQGLSASKRLACKRFVGPWMDTCLSTMKQEA